MVSDALRDRKGLAMLFETYDFIRAQLRILLVKFDFPVSTRSSRYRRSYTGSSKDPIAVTLHEMDRFGVEKVHRCLA